MYIKFYLWFLSHSFCFFCVTQEFCSHKTMSVQALENVKLEALVPKPPRAFGKARLVFLEPKTKIVTPKLQVAWNIRPSSDDGGDKFSLEVNIEEDSAFKNALQAFDARIRTMAFQNKKVWFGKEADEVTSEADLRLKHTMSIKKGNEKQDGSRYADTLKFKVTGWQNFVDEVLYRGDGDNKFPNDVRWKTRHVTSPQGQGGPEDNQTKFYICENVDPTTGKEQMVPWTPCQDPAGNEIKDALGNTTYEFVGPKHCQPGCQIRVVFEPSMIWLSAKFGVTMHAKQVFITPAAPVSKSTIEGIEIKDCVDPVLAKKAARAAMATNDLRDDDDAAAAAAYSDSESTMAKDLALAKEIAAAKDISKEDSSKDLASALPVSPSSKKRDAEKPEKPSKSKKVKVDEDF